MGLLREHATQNKFIENVDDFILATPKGKVDVKGGGATTEGCPLGEKCSGTVTICKMCFNEQVPGNIALGFGGLSERLERQISQAVATLQGDEEDPEDVASIILGNRLRDVIDKMGTPLGAHGMFGQPFGIYGPNSIYFLPIAIFLSGDEITGADVRKELCELLTEATQAKIPQRRINIITYCPACNDESWSR